MAISDEFLTRCVHAGLRPEQVTGAVAPPIFQTSTFAQSEPGKHSGYDYSRGTNPTRTQLEEGLATLEKAKYALAFSSGLAAIQAVMQILDPPNFKTNKAPQILVSDDVYGGTGRLFRKLFAPFGFEFVFIDFSDLKLVEKACTSSTKLIWAETPTNPLLKICSINGLAKIAAKVGALLAVDNTFASPVFQSPLKQGAHIVMHSTTKYIGGHTDVIGGALMTSSSKLFEKLKFIQFAAGAVPGPFECFLLLRSMRTLALRMAQHENNAMEVAKFLEKHKRVKKVYYPGLASHPGHKLAKEQMTGFSGMVSFELDANYSGVKVFLKKLKIFTLAESLGGVESLINHPERMTHASVPEETRKKLGIGPNLIRLSVGIEAIGDILKDLKQALKEG